MRVCVCVCVYALCMRVCVCVCVCVCARGVCGCEHTTKARLLFVFELSHFLFVLFCPFFVFALSHTHARIPPKPVVPSCQPAKCACVPGACMCVCVCMCVFVWSCARTRHRGQRMSIWRSHVTRVNDACHTYGHVMSHAWTRHVSRMNECRTCELMCLRTRQSGPWLYGVATICRLIKIICLFCKRAL